jgi:hypothetical protein
MMPKDYSLKFRVQDWKYIIKMVTTTQVNKVVHIKLLVVPHNCITIYNTPCREEKFDKADLI